jgi:pheromone shutdown-related protein TraB
MQITILGTSHIARESLQKVKEHISTGKYDIVALELDAGRLQALRQKVRPKTRFSDIFRVGVKGFLFSLLGAWAERKLGELVGVKPGAEMLTAYRFASKHGADIVLIDQRIDITLKRLSEQLTWNEKWNFVVDLLTGFFKRPVIQFDLTKVPSQEVIQQMVAQVKDRYPNFYKVLVTERNHFMARNLRAIMLRFPDKRILAVVGAGHEEELRNLIEPEIQYSYNIG